MEFLTLKGGIMCLKRITYWYIVICPKCKRYYFHDKKLKLFYWKKVVENIEHRTILNCICNRCLAEKG